VTEITEGELDTVRRNFRIIAIVRAAERCSLAPLPSDQLQTLAYLADALAPVWDMPILDGRRLKRRSGPLSPTLQYDVDRLVGRGLLEAQQVRHARDEDGNWRLEARYSLNHALCEPILALARKLPMHAAQLTYVREVVYAASAFGARDVAEAALGDAAYSDLADGSVVDLAPWRPGAMNASTEVALRFGELMSGELTLGQAEMIHLYVRAVYKRLPHAA
jgi:hypothetical protein